MKTILSRVIIPTLFLIAVLFVGCGKKQQQYAVEARVAHQIIALLKWYELEQPGDRVTNLAQIFGLLERKYPYEWHRDFRAYGKHAGFNNSVFEKYVFLSPGFTNRSIKGEILALNAQPVPDPEGSGRIVISRIGTNMYEYRRAWVAEKRVQEIFKEIGAKIPKPIPMPPPPPPPPDAGGHEWNIWAATQGIFHALAWLLGLGVERAGQLQWFTFMFIASVSALCMAWVFWNWVKRRRRPR